MTAVTEVEGQHRQQELRIVAWPLRWEEEPRAGLGVSMEHEETRQDEDHLFQGRKHPWSTRSRR